MTLHKLSFKTFIHNIYNLFAYDYHQADIIRAKQWNYLNEIAARSEILRCYPHADETPYSDELNYIEKHGVSIFPYSQLKRVPHTESGWDSKLGLPYTIIDNKRLYFPNDMTHEEAANLCDYYIEYEQLLGGGYQEKAPHQYQSDNVHIEEGDVMVDVGAAEGLVTLSVIEKVSNAYLIECDKKWWRPLQATFAPWKDKCTIVSKSITDHDGKHTIKLDTLLNKERERPIFIKMDIEGNEIKVLDSSKEFLTKRSNIKMAVCTYHRQTDADIISALISNIGYQQEFSEGWILYKDGWAYNKINFNDPWEYPFFRHGMIRAWK